MNKIIYSIIGLLLLNLNNANAAISLGGTKVDAGLKGSNDGADTAVQTLIKNVMLFLYLVAVVYGLYGGFLILTAGGKEDNVKKGRTVIVQALIGLVVIWLASSVVQWLVTSILGVTA
ncbi:MAG: hypothetical protein WC850_03580 [Candidatus Gracilibacteria bacterium]